MIGISTHSAAAWLMAAVVTAATANPPAPAPAQPQDPGQIVCEKQEVLGSRLGSRRICMTRAEWAERYLQDRRDVEKVQDQSGLKGE